MSGSDHRGDATVHGTTVPELPVTTTEATSAPFDPTEAVAAPDGAAAPARHVHAHAHAHAFGGRRARPAVPHRTHP